MINSYKLKKVRGSIIANILNLTNIEEFNTFDKFDELHLVLYCGHFPSRELLNSNIFDECINALVNICEIKG